MSKSHVVWTQREWELIATWFMERSIDPMHRGFSNALSDAQDEKLPVERRRSTVGLDPKTRYRVQEVINTVRIYMDRLPPKSAIEVKLPQAEELSTEDLLVELARRIARLLEPRTEAQNSVLEQLKFWQQKFHEVDRGFHPKHDPTPPSEERRCKLKVLIVGPDSVAQDRLAKDFAGTLALRFVGYQDNPALIGTRCDQAVAIACVTRFVSHAQQEAAKATKIPVKLVSTIQELRAWLSTL